MSEDEIRSSISAKEDEITKIEEDATKKEASAEKGIEAEYDAKITAAETAAASENRLLEEAQAKAAEWKAKLGEKKGAAKLANKEVSVLAKEKTSALKIKLKEIDSEKKAAVKAVNAEIKQLNKQLSDLQKMAAAQ